VDRVRDAADIVGVVSDYVSLKSAGTRHKGLCPFHQEKTPSFSVDPDAKLFYCFGCQTGGDLFKFVQLYENVSFPEAVEILANRCGIRPPEDRPRTPEERARDRAFEVQELARAFFVHMLDQEAGAACRRYLDDRGLTRETLDLLGLGCAPEGWDRLLNHARPRGVPPADLAGAGLAVARKDGSGHYDRFRNRLIFPIRDVQGRTIAFGGRAIAPDDEPKYLNSPESPTYVKGEHLYGLDLAREAIRREGYAIVVEGYMDLAALVQAGFRQTVASLGTAFTPAQARLIARYTQRVVVSYDGDAAGTSAATKSLDLLLAHGLDVRVVDLPAGMDPDDVIRERGSDAYGKLVRTAPGYLDWVLEREGRTRDLNRPEDKVAVINAVLPHLARLGNPIERVAWAAKVADAVQLEDRLVQEELQRALRSAGTSIREPRTSHAPRVHQVEAYLVLLLLGEQADRDAIFDRLEEEDLEAGSPVRPIVDAIRAMHERDEQEARIEYSTVFQALEDDGHRDLLTKLAFRDESMEDTIAVDGCLEALRRRRLEREQREIQTALRSADDPVAIEDLLARKTELGRQIASLSQGMAENGAR
jgi:DNA primase